MFDSKTYKLLLITSILASLPRGSLTIDETIVMTFKRSQRKKVFNNKIKPYFHYLLFNFEYSSIFLFYYKTW